MRTLTLALLVAAALGAGACTDYFQGTTLVFEFDKLPSLHRLPPLPETLPEGTTAADFAYEEPVGGNPGNPEGALCADDDYVADPVHASMIDTIDVPYQQRFEYHAWATINDAPVRIARFTTRECTTSNQDTVIKNAITTVSFTRLSDAEYAYPKKPSQWYGVVNAVISSVPSGGATILTPVRLDQATEIFVTREVIPDDALEVDLASGPRGTVLMRGTPARVGLVYKATLAKVSGAASGLLTAIPADRVSAW